MPPVIETLPVARQMTGYFPTFIASYNMEGIVTSGAIDDELWSILEYYSEIEEVGLSFLLQKGVLKKDLRKTYRSFRAYVRQAKNYYYSAKSLHYRSAALLYYYCFLNLAKAGLILRYPKISDRKLKHGLILDTNRKFNNFGEVVIKFEKNGKTTPISEYTQVFPLLYETYFNKSLSLNVVNISKLLGYVSDVAIEYRKCDYGLSKLHLGVYATAMHSTNNTTWALLGIRNWGQLSNYKKALASFSSEFEQVDLDKNIARELWAIDGAVHSTFQYFQTRSPRAWISNDTPYPPVVLGQETILALNNMFQSNVFSDKPDFMIAEPYSINKQFPMNEPLAIYMTMYYLGSLVRYKPDYLETLLDKKENWIIESFTKSAPLTFLREFVPWIIQMEYRIKTR